MLSDEIEVYVTGSYSNSYVSVLHAPRGIRNTQPYGGAAALASSNSGIVLPVWICPSGVNCATPDCTPNPNNRYATTITKRRLHVLHERGQFAERPRTDRAGVLCKLAQFPDHLALCRADWADVQGGCVVQVPI
jgi:hypothetical protein